MSDAAVDRLPPAARFCARALAAGMAPADLARVLRADDTTIAKHLRVGLAAIGAPPPPPGATETALLAAVEPLVAAARRPPGRTPSTTCLSDDVSAALAAGALDGPLLLAEAEHVADCPACLERIASFTVTEAPAPVAIAPRRGLDVVVTIVCALVVAVLLVWFALRWG